MIGRENNVPEIDDDKSNSSRVSPELQKAESTAKEYTGWITVGCVVFIIGLPLLYYGLTKLDIIIPDVLGAIGAVIFVLSIITLKFIRFALAAAASSEKLGQVRRGHNK
jgi:hypothetical protein